ncbi:MAG: YqaE/Pmp3 family membrane protein [Magnetococcales bacterium]|nr:YqaE/Pmp3 family membrane protein [Magnetococcales bacterium]
MAKVVHILIALFFPPVEAFLQVGFGLQFWVNIVLTLLGWLPGCVHALWLLLR